MKYFSPSEVIELPLLGNDDILKRGKGRMMKWAPHVWSDMNLSSLKIARRERFEINKRTNSIDLPCSILQLSSVNVMDHCGIEYPVYRNSRLRV
jgi:hypothetical protein